MMTAGKLRWVVLAALLGGACGDGDDPPGDGGADTRPGGSADMRAGDVAAGADGSSAGSGGDGGAASDVPGSDGPGVADAGDSGVAPPAPPSMAFQISTPATQVLPDGVSMIPLVIKGMQADGSPGLDQVVLRLSRPGAGFVRPRVLRLGGEEPQSYFTPCLATTPGCLGPVKVQVARASAPDQIVAESAELNIAPGEGVTSAATCLLGGNVLFIDGTETRLDGVRLLRKQTFSDMGSARSSVVLNVRESTQMSYDGWELRFSTFNFGMGEDLAVKTYLNADDSSPVSPRPHMTIGSPQMRCNGQGAFQIHRLVWAGNQLQEIVVSFEQVCEYVYQKVRGCIRYVAP